MSEEYEPLWRRFCAKTDGKNNYWSGFLDGFISTIGLSALIAVAVFAFVMFNGLSAIR